MLSPYWTYLLGSILFTAAMAQPAPDLAPSDLKITTRHSTGSSSFNVTEYISGENSRSEMQLFSGNVQGHHRALIRKKEAEQYPGLRS